MEKRIGSFVCQKCGRNYKQKQHLESHLKYVCGVEPQFHCPMCSYSSKYRGDLKKHVERVHKSTSIESTHGNKERKYLTLKPNLLIEN